MVRIDIFLMFRIVEPKTFINELSPHKLTDLLRSAQEEAVRTLARTIFLTDIYDLVQFDEKTILDDISKKFTAYGVRITQLMITEVKCRAEIKERLQRETIVKSELELQTRKQEFDLLQVKEADEVAHARLENEISKQKFIDSYKKKFLEVEKEIAETRQRTHKRMAEIKASERRTCSKIKEEAEKFASRVEEQMRASMLKIQSEAKSTVSLLMAQQNSYKTETMSKTDLVVSEHNSKITQELGNAEAVASKKLIAKRDFERKIAELDVLQSLSVNAGNVLISGNSNGNIVSEIISSNIQKELYLKQ